MTKLLVDKKAADATLPRRKSRASTRTRSRQEQQPQRPVELGGGAASAPGLSAALSATERPSAKERRERSEALAYTLAAAPDLTELVAVIKEHGRSAVSRAAAVRPDLMPTVNGELAHIALSLADLD